nr:hypothetical protein [Bacilli bacterium]
MEGLLMSQYGGLGLIIAFGVLVLVLFIVVRFFKMIFSSAFIGFLLSLFSYFVYDYIFIKVPLIACIAFLLCVTGFASRGFIGKLFALLGTIFSAYLILGHLGIFFTI